MAFKFVALCSLLAVANAGFLAPATTYSTAPAVAYAHPSVDAVASTHQNVVRSFGGTVSHHSKAIDTPYSSVRKQDTRITNNVYTPSVAKTISYATPAATKTYLAPAPSAATAFYTHAAPVVEKTVYSQAAPVVQKTLYTQATPVVQKTVYTQAAPVVYSHPQPTAAVYTHAAPTVAKTVTYAAPAPVYPQHQNYHLEVPTKTVGYAAPTVAKTVTYAAPATTTSFNHGSAATTYTHSAPGVSSYGSSQTVHYSPAEMVSHMSFDGFGTHWAY